MLNSKPLPEKYERLLMLLKQIDLSPTHGHGKVEISYEKGKIVLVRVSSDYRPKFEMENT